jgi:AcrR family transcriptional regulator
MNVETSKKSRKSGRPTQEESDRLTRLILDAARDSFVRRGFRDTTILQLATDCGVTRRSIVARFATPDALLVAVAARDIDTYASQVDNLQMRQEHLWEDLERLFRKLWERGSDATEAALLRAYLGEMIRLPDLATIIRDFYFHLLATLEQKILEAQKHGMFRKFKASTVASTAISLVIANPRVRTMILDLSFEDAAASERYFSDVWTLIRDVA